MAIKAGGTRISARLFIPRIGNVLLVAALSVVSALGMSPDSHAADSNQVSPIVGPVATQATCGKDDRPEGGVQGDAPLAERFTSGIPRAFNCNLDLVGQARGDGAALGMAIADRCMYFSQQIAPNMPIILEHPGVAIVDAADPKAPKIIGHLDVPGAIDSDQSITVSQKLMITSSDFRQNESGQMVSPGPGDAGQPIDIFDIADCTHPVLKFSGVVPHFEYHNGEFSADGNIFWAASGPYKKVGSISALDVSDPSHPQLIAQWHPDDPLFNYLHAVSVSDDGNTAYVSGGNKGFASSWKDLNKEPPQGLFVLDLREVQARKPDAKIRLISTLFWNDATSPQFAFPMTVKGHKYVWFLDLMGALPTFDVAQAGRSVGEGPQPLRAFADPAASSALACATYSTRPPFGYVSVIDIDNPEKPARVSGLRLAVNQPKYCPLAVSEPRLRGYLPMWCNVDNYQDAQMMACAYGESGVRVFDIRDVKHPREVAYYKPAAAGSAVRKASNFQAFLDKSGTLQGSYHSTDLTASVYFANGGKELWITSIDGGAQILRFSDELMKREKELFTRDNSCNGKLRGVHGCW
jgi:hypothetical protein